MIDKILSASLFYIIMFQNSSHILKKYYKFFLFQL
jgi:hypothetical protein